MKIKASIATLVVALLLLGGCGSKQPSPSVAPYAPPAHGSGSWVNVDQDVARIYGDPPLTGRLPGAPTWSPDGKTLAYLRTRNTPDGPATGLWIHETALKRARPLVADAGVSVEDFAWIDGGRILLTIDGDLHMTGMAGDLLQLTKTEGYEEAARPSADGKKVAFVRDHDLYVLDIDTGTERPVTTGGEEGRYFGGVTWVYGEEFATAAGFAWAPKGDLLWLYSVDETPVPGRVVLSDAEGKTRSQAYPRAGEPNPIVRVGVADASTDKPVVTWLDTGDKADVYLPQVTWFPAGDKLLVARLDRLQTVLNLLACDPSGECSSIVEERDPRWVNLPPAPVFSKRGDRFYWISERDGFAHIYAILSDGVVVHRLTEGEWVVNSVDSVDEEGGYVYFTGSPRAPVYQGIYRVEIEGGDLEELSPEGGVHSALFAPDSSRFVDIHSDLNTPPRADLFAADGRLEVPLEESERGVYENDLIANDLFPIEGADGTELWAQMTRPRALEPGKRYPVLVYVYGGPGAQVVRDHFRTSFQAWRNLLAKRGILVFSLDGRGSAGRGREFEATIHRNLGRVELEDQLAGAKYLKAQPFVDKDRIGIFGWSYGGTMALRALLLGGDVFKTGVSVAPVTDWGEYDTAYTERYMQRPSDNPDGYTASTLLDRVESLEAPLLLVHGMGDDNVHLANSMRMVNALIKEGKVFDWFAYPGKKHGIRGAAARTHLFTLITRFLEENL